MCKILAFFFFGLPLMAQTVLPSSPGATVPSINWSATTQTITLNGTPIFIPSVSVNASQQLVINGTIVPSISLESLNLTGGSAYANGTYLVTITNGALKYTPYVAPTIPPTPISIPFSVTAQTLNPQSSTLAVQIAIPAGTTVTKLFAMPPYPANATAYYPFVWNVYQLNATTAIFQAKNVSASSGAFPAGSWILAVN